jgi:hypothetical protein
MTKAVGRVMKVLQSMKVGQRMTAVDFAKKAGGFALSVGCTSLIRHKIMKKIHGAISIERVGKPCFISLKRELTEADLAKFAPKAKPQKVPRVKKEKVAKVSKKVAKKNVSTHEKQVDSHVSIESQASVDDFFGEPIKAE